METKDRYDISPETKIAGLLTPEEISTADWAVGKALEEGASDCRVTLSKSLQSSFSTLNGEIDKVAQSMDRSLGITLFVEGRFGSFSTNRVEKEELSLFIRKAVDTVKMLAPDPFRTLPSPERTMKDASIPLYLATADLDSYSKTDPISRRDFTFGTTHFLRWQDAPSPSYSIISEEVETTDGINDIYKADSKGMRARQIETSFEHYSSVTIQDGNAERVSGYSWQSHPLKDTFLGLSPEEDSEKALRKAVAKIGARPLPSGKYTMVVDYENSSSLLNPILNALSAFAMQQKSSFMTDSLGKKLFPEFLTIWDRPLEKGAVGSRLFDMEGVRNYDSPIIENGVVSRYYVSTYIANKTGMEPSVDFTRVVVTPTASSRDEAVPERYILVEGFVGGNCNPVTGDFSYGIEGSYMERGKDPVPVKGMLVTGNMLGLWGRLVAVVGETSPKMVNKVGTLVFDGVDFSGE